jgi:acetyl esterase
MAQTVAGYTIRNGSVAGRDGTIPIRDYLPTAQTGAAPFLWIHGGGFVAGGLDQKESDAPARYLAARGRWVRAIDYRLAPNPGLFRPLKLHPDPNRFPAAHHDVLDVAAALREESGEPISIGGASAGANLAAGAVLAMRDNQTELPLSQVLVYGAFHSEYPVNDDVESSLTGPLVRWMFNPAMVRRIVLNYVGDESVIGNPYAFPGGADVHGLPPTLSLDASNDRLRKSGHSYHEELTAAGVTTEERVLHARHGFLNAYKRKPFVDGMPIIENWLTRFDPR